MSSLFFALKSNGKFTKLLVTETAFLEHCLCLYMELKITIFFCGNKRLQLLNCVGTTTKMRFWVT